MRIDMHTHTLASDGQYSPREVLQMAKKIGLERIAITDHDTLDGLKEAKAAAKEIEIELIPGIEISTYLDEEIHMLGLWIDEDNEALAKECQDFMESRQNRGKRIVEFLESKGVHVDLDEVAEFAGFGSMGRPHFAWALQKGGYVNSKQEAFEKYLDTPEFHAYTDRRKPTPLQAIELIHGAGGKAVIAHPGLLKMDVAKQEELIATLVEAGLDGIEAYYNKYTDTQIRYYMELAQKHGVKVTCGSDYHGEKVKPLVKLGMSYPDHLKEYLLIM